MHSLVAVCILCSANYGEVFWVHVSAAFALSVILVEIHPPVSPLSFDFASHFLFSSADFF